MAISILLFLLFDQNFGGNFNVLYLWLLNDYDFLDLNQNLGGQLDKA